MAVNNNSNYIILNRTSVGKSASNDFGGFHYIANLERIIKEKNHER